MTKKEVPITQLSLQQLSHVGKSLDQEIQSLSGSYTSLKVVMNKFKDNKNYIKDLIESKDKDMLIPLTQSVYIPGKCSDIKHLLIELGANYLVETDVKKAEEFCERKVQLLNENMDKVDKLIQDKSKIMNEINHCIIEKNKEVLEQQNKIKK